MKTKKTAKIITLVLVLAMLMSVSAFAASSYQSENVDYTVGGRLYYGFSVMNIFDNTADAGTFVSTKDYVNVPIGYLGASAKLISSSGTVLAVKPMSYNTIPDYFEPSYTGKVGFTGYVYSKGQVSMYTGPSYVTYDAPQTVNATSTTASLASQNPQKYPTNASGETYGSALLSDAVGSMPDLVASIGSDGIEGYIRANDLDPKVKNPAEAMAYMTTINNNRTIPLYDKDGSSIGSFELDALDAEIVAEAKAALAELNGNTSATTPRIKQRTTISVESSKALLRATLVKGDYPKNAKGESYGAESLSEVVGHMPDLIAAMGTNGLQGYLKLADWSSSIVNNPQEAMDYMNSRPTSRTIPLYDLNNNTIGEFVLG